MSDAWKTDVITAGHSRAKAQETLTRQKGNGLALGVLRLVPVVLWDFDLSEGYEGSDWKAYQD
jgi:hypothetical protein